MCALYGSVSLSMFEVLYEANQPRGNFASSLVTLMKSTNDIVDDVSIIKQQGYINIDNLKLKEKEHAYYAGHVQAPTSAVRKFNYDTSHPFEQEDWMVFHNGVLTNHEELNEKYCSWNVNKVDTSVIVSMLQEEWTDMKCKKKPISSIEEVNIIEKICNRLEGTFALVIINTTSLNVYLVRQGSTLFYDNNGNYSSIQGKTMKEVPEGKVLKLDREFKFKEVGKFKSKSPFLIV
jgi:glucosamine 6-phosphate synthetase-like amidotransferase/phosphosugar isomerase protein